MLPEIVDKTYENRWIDRLDEKDYHADTTAVSSSALKEFKRSPAHYYSKFILKSEEKDTDALRFGRVVHLALLQPKKFFETVRVTPDFGDQRSPANRTKKAEWIAGQGSGIEFISKEERKKLLLMIESFQRNSYAMKLVKDACFEVSGYFRDPETGIKCRIRPDILRTDLSAMPDIKTTHDASPDAFSKQCWDYGYYLQMAFYSFGIQQITGSRPNLPCFIAVEKSPPYLVTVYAADEGMMSRGDQTVRRLLDCMKINIEKNHWPGYFDDGVGSISLPSWTDWKAEI